jgi:hypothetical protein
MKKSLLFIALIGTFSILSVNVSAQESSNQELTMGISEVQLIKAVNAEGVTGAIVLELTTTVAGTAISGGTGTSYAHVSSIVTSLQTRKMTASVTGVPTGTELSVATLVPTTGSFDGTVGTGTNEQVLSATAVDIATGIGSCYTGNAAGDGYRLNYTWEAGTPGTYGTIFATGGTNATVVLTLTAGI